MDYKSKYLKYKLKYSNLKEKILKLSGSGGSPSKEKKLISVGIYVGRFQPLHNAHLHIILESLKNEDHTIVFLAAANKQNEKNPYNVAIRTEFIISSIISINPTFLQKLSIIPIDDTSDEEYDLWFDILSDKIIESLNQKFQTKVTKDTYNVDYNLYLYGSKKDVSTTDYINKILTLSIVKNNKLIDAININEKLTLNATEIRAIINNNPSDKLKILLLQNNINEPVADIIVREKEKNKLDT